MKRVIFFNKVVYLLPIIVWDKRDEEHNVLFIGWLTFLYYKQFKKEINDKETNKTRI